MKKNLLILCSILCLLQFVNAQSANKKPNIILIMADDMGFECLGVNGSLSYQTPVLDKLANEGMRFTKCISQPVCTPSRVKIMTGKYNYRNYVDFGYLDVKEKTFGNMMKEAGYKTMIAGKWQLSGAKEKRGGYDDMQRPQQFGFDEYCLWQLTKKGPRFANPFIEQNGKLLETTIDDYGPDIVSNYILDFLERNKKESFFVYYPMILVHSPFVPTPDSPEWKNPKTRSKHDNKFFADMVNYSDKVVGKIMSKLKELKIDDNTIVIFTGDNGTNTNIVSKTKLYDKYPGGKSSMPDNGTHVPMIVSWPAGKQKGIEINELIEFSDFMPTFAEAAGVTSYPTDGQSFFKTLSGKEKPPRETAFVHYHPYPEKVRDKDGRFVRTLDYKLYHDGRFYFIPEDKWEKKPLQANLLSNTQKAIYNKLKTEMDSQPPYDFTITSTDNSDE
ncbi:sulfatase-like hydrolase/transferase [Reichenbachiella sp. MALMAid0571]|uniref:sulfatase-like hydrolase/transferase n=1 Tax=Reichenbachiella sp. MALMAid0571 TaxID=3143939 RepID=UPI0032DFFAD2